jgi:histone-lysine N-methyltransferase SETMAR
LTPVFWDKGGTLIVDFLEEGSAILEKYCVTLLDELKKELISKRCGKLSKGILFLQDNANPHKAVITHQKLADLHFEVLKHSGYSPDLAPSNYYLFPNLEKHFKGSFLALRGPH